MSGTLTPSPPARQAIPLAGAHPALRAGSNRIFLGARLELVPAGIQRRVVQIKAIKKDGPPGRQFLSLGLHKVFILALETLQKMESQAINPEP